VCPAMVVSWLDQFPRWCAARARAGLEVGEFPTRRHGSRRGRSGWSAVCWYRPGRQGTGAGAERRQPWSATPWGSRRRGLRPPRCPPIFAEGRARAVDGSSVVGVSRRGDGRDDRVDKDTMTAGPDGLRGAVRAVAVHAAEPWPHTVICRNDRAPFPCRWHRWGMETLRAAGWSDEDIATAAQTLQEEGAGRSATPRDG
jgi:hypothetical protein